jgi:ppGpp synthetase/RelA/SpoT-type nucleotidyltranferase
MLEEHIRQQYEEAYPELDALRLWISNRCSELCHQKSYVHGFKVRIKEINSLVEKIKQENEKIKKHNDDLENSGSPRIPMQNFDSVKEGITDLVGSRIIVYTPSGIVRINKILLDLHKRKKITISVVKGHSPKNQIFDFLKDIENSLKDEQINYDSENVEKLAYDERGNKTGYLCVHYILSPNPNEVIFENVFGEKSFPKLELQVRTLMHHAWGELEHKIRYKNKNELSCDLLLSNLSALITQIEQSLENLERSDTYQTPSMPNSATHSSNTRFRTFDESIVSLIENFEDREISLKDFSTHANSMESSNDSLINELDQHRMDIEYLSSNKLLAELLLKTSEFERSYAIYEELLQIENLGSNERAKVLLRISEASRGMNNKEKSTEYLEALLGILDDLSYSPESNEHELYSGAARHSWNAGKFESAVKLSRKSCEFVESELTRSPTEKLERSRTKYLSNYIYYSLDSLEFSDETLRELNSDERIKLGHIITEIAPEVSKLEKMELNSYQFDTLAWYFYHVACFERQSGINDVVKVIRRAREFNDLCRATLIEEGREESEAVLIVEKHNREIETLYLNHLREQIDLKSVSRT